MIAPLDRTARHRDRNHPFVRRARRGSRCRRVTLQLSKGVSEALINTCGGLAIGIPAMIFYAFFRGRAQRLISELESASTHIIALLSLQHARRPERAPALLEDEF